MQKGFDQYKLIMFFSLILVVLLAGCSTGEKRANGEEEKETPVKIASVTKGTLDIQNEVVGKVKAKSNVSVASRVAGELVSLSVAKGDWVKKGHILGKVNTRDLDIALSMEKNALEQSKKQLKVAEESYQLALNNLANAKEALALAELNVPKQGEKVQKTELMDGTTLNQEKLLLQYEDAKKNRERMEALYEVGAIALVELERAKSSEKMAELAIGQGRIGSDQAVGSYQQASNNLKNAEGSLKQAKISVEQAKINVEQAVLRVKQANTRLADASIVAPVSGQVTEITAEVGEMISGQMPTFTIVSLNSVIIEATVSADQLVLFGSGKEVSYEITTLDQIQLATISYVSPVANQAGLYQIEAVADNSNGQLKEGMITKFLINESVVSDTILVPTAAVVTSAGSSKVFVIKGDRAIEKKVEILYSQTKETAVTGELKDGDKVVVKGQNTLTDGNLVQIVEGAY